MEKSMIIKALDSFHKRILETDLAEKIYETEIMAIIDALSLINELTAEAENYKAVAEKQQSISMDRHFEIKRLTEENEKLTKLLDDRCDRCIERERADTAKYLIDRIKGYYEVHKGRIRTASLIYYIEQIAKEMLEVKDE